VTGRPLFVAPAGHHVCAKPQRKAVVVL